MHRLTVAVGFFLALGSADAGGDGPALPDTDCVQLLRHARIAEMRDDPSTALALLQQAARDYPGELVVATALWELHRRHELSAEDLAAAGRTMTAVLTNPEAPLRLGTLQYVASLPDLGTDELMQLRRAVERRLTAENVPPQFWDVLAMLHLRLGDREAGRDALLRRLEAGPDDRTRWQLVQLERELDNWEGAGAQLRELSLREEVNPFVQMSLAEALGRVGAYDELIARLDLLGEEILVYDYLVLATMRDLMLQVAWNFRDAANDEYAEAIFRRVLAIDPNDREALLAVLYLYSSEEEREQYEASLRQQRVSETDPDKLLADGARLLAAGNAGEAIELLERAAFALPDSEAAWYNLGLAALKLERWERAESAYRQAVRTNPARIDAVLNHAISLANLDRCGEAVPELESVERSAPEMAAALYWLYFCHEKLGNVDQTKKYLLRYRDAR